MSQTVRFQHTLRRLAMVDEAFIQDEAGLGLDQARHIGPRFQDRRVTSRNRDPAER